METTKQTQTIFRHGQRVFLHYMTSENFEIVKLPAVVNFGGDESEEWSTIFLSPVDFLTENKECDWKEDRLMCTDYLRLEFEELPGLLFTLYQKNGKVRGNPEILDGHEVLQIIRDRRFDRTAKDREFDIDRMTREVEAAKLKARHAKTISCADKVELCAL